jgi:hypothetical protein
MPSSNESKGKPMQIFQPEMVLAIATLCTALSTLVWAFRRKR